MESNSIIAKFKKLNLSGRKKDRNIVECFDVTKPSDAPPEKLTLRAVRAAGRGTFGSVLQARDEFYLNANFYKYLLKILCLKMDFRVENAKIFMLKKLIKLSIRKQ